MRDIKRLVRRIALALVDLDDDLSGIAIGAVEEAITPIVAEELRGPEAS